MTTKSPAETFGQQAEAAAGKRMSWMDTAARLAGIGVLGGTGYAVRRHLQRQAAINAQVQWAMNAPETRQQRDVRRAIQEGDASQNVWTGLVARSAGPHGRRHNAVIQEL